jgi:hypothetical protein
MPSDQLQPSVAFDGNNYMVVWTERRTSVDNFDVFAQRLTPEGLKLDGDGIRVARGRGKQVAARIVYNGTNFVVVWQDQRSGDYDVYASRVTSSGTVLDPQGLRISNDVGQDEVDPTAAASGHGTVFIAWSSEAPTGTQWDIRGTRFAYGAAVGPEVAVSAAPGYEFSPAVASDGNGFFVTWAQNADGTLGNTDIGSARVSAAGVVSASTPVSGAVGDQTTPAIAYDGTRYLVAWADRRATTHWAIYASRVTKFGAVVDASGIPVAMDAADDEFPVVSANGAFLVAWQRHPCCTTDIRGARVDGAGNVIDPVPTKLASGSGPVGVTRGPAHRWALTFRHATGRAAMKAIIG